jgi:hypothetical protein
VILATVNAFLTPPAEGKDPHVPPPFVKYDYLRDEIFANIKIFQ